MKNIKNLILELIYPPKCIFCGKRISPGAKISVCPDCSNNLPYCKTYLRCKICGKPISQREKHYCRSCTLSRRYVTRITSPFVHTENARSAVIAFKSEQNSRNARVFSFYMAGMINQDMGGVEFDAVVSVPPRKKKPGSEKFDQAACLAKEVALRLSLPYIPKCMEQTKFLYKQSSLPYGSRLKNVKGGFAVKKSELIKNKVILLVDDVCTSGATISECARVLKEAGAHKVYAATATTVPAPQ